METINQITIEDLENLIEDIGVRATQLTDSFS